LERVFGDLPLELDGDALDQLDAMAAVNPGRDSPFRTLAQAIRHHSGIRVEAEH
jgi:hypothetical protein